MIEALGQAIKAAAFLVPSGLGVQEGGFVLLCGLFGIDSGTALALSLAKRVPDVVLGLPASWCGRTWRRGGPPSPPPRARDDPPSRPPPAPGGARGLSVLLWSGAALAQSVTVDLGAGGTTERALQLVALITVLAVAPSVLVIGDRLHPDRGGALDPALGPRHADGPADGGHRQPRPVPHGLRHGPHGREAYNAGIEPLVAGRITQAQAFERASAPFKTFMLKNVREKDLKLFLDLARCGAAGAGAGRPGDRHPGLQISELRRAFEIGFLLFIPFLSSTSSSPRCSWRSA